ncbi:MAG: hypothetical protein GYA21_02070 [Myxococcales bacterium]|nr:hypothetical protein [Myxococcales bacterium]
MRAFAVLMLCVSFGAAAAPPAGEPVTARQVAYRLLRSLSHGDLAQARELALSGEEFRALSRRAQSAADYQKTRDAFLDSVAHDLRAGLVFRDAEVVDCLVLPESDKNHRLVLAVVYAHFFMPDGKPLEHPLALTFVQAGEGWKLLVR